MNSGNVSAKTILARCSCVTPQVGYNTAASLKGAAEVIWAIVNQKGGVGKTTTAVNLAAAWAEGGSKCLVVDMDPQGHATLHLGHRPDELDGRTIWSALQAELFAPFDPGHLEPSPSPSLRPLILRAVHDAIDLVPANLELSLAEPALGQAFNRERRVARLLRSVSGEYDRILLDCPPYLGILTINALAAADQVLVPTNAEFLSVRGLQAVAVTILRVQQELNFKLGLRGVLITRYDQRTVHSRRLEETLRGALSGRLPVLKTHIPLNVDLQDAAAAGMSALTYRPRCPGAEAYRCLAKELDDVA